jgi:pimeloyl-ACP methyl ester carboxylesterase
MTTRGMREAGKPAVIALHCSAGSGEMWRPLADRLGDRFMLVAPDLIGCGLALAWHGARAFSASDEAARAVAIIDSGNAPVHLVGHSYGGGVALRVARERPRRIASLTLYEPMHTAVLNLLGTEGRAARGDITAVARALTAALHTGAYLAGARHFVDYWSRTGSFDAMSPKAQAAVARQLPKLCLEFRAMARERVPLQAWRRFDFPVLLLQGEHSPPPGRLIARELHRAMRHSSLHIVHGAGHMGPLTHASQVATMTADHIVRSGSKQLRPIVKGLAA